MIKLRSDRDREWRRMKDSLVDRFTSSRRSVNSEAPSISSASKVSSLSPLVLSRSSSLLPSSPSAPMFLSSPWSGECGARERERKTRRKRIEGNVRAERGECIICQLTGIEASSRKSRRRFAPGSIGGRFYPRYVTHRRPGYDSLRLFINSRGGVICAPGSLHILRINGGRSRGRDGYLRPRSDEYGATAIPFVCARRSRANPV